MSNMHSLFIVFVVSLVTIAIRFAPFVIFRSKTPTPILYLGKVLPFAIIGMLVVYCLKQVSVFTKPHGLPELIAISLVVGLHKWKHNTLLSILVGTLTYMALVQLIF